MPTSRIQGGSTAYTDRTRKPGYHRIGDKNEAAGAAIAAAVAGE